jgi:isoleucyl-tRNA synthetase
VHHCDYPVYHQEWRDPALEEGMASVQAVVSLGHSLRKEHKLKVRQPLPLAEVACQSIAHLEFLKSQQHLIAEELNVKKVHFHTDDHLFVTLQAKPNFRILGKKVGKKMPEVQKRVSQLTFDELQTLVNGQAITIHIDQEPLVLTSEEVQVAREVRPGLIAANAGEVTIALDTTLNEELILEGLAREIVNKVNTMRRESRLSVSDRITVNIDSTPKVKQAFEIHRDWVMGEILAVDVSFAPSQGTSWDLNGEPARLEIKPLT